MSSLFGHLATRFSEKPEDLATEALHFVLQRSETAHASFLEFARSFGVTIPDDISFKTRPSRDDRSIPDLVGTTTANEAPFIIESKFWAGLTDKQPIAYLNHLPASGAGLLLFIAPSERFPALWPELLHRCREGKMVVQKVKTVNGKAARIGDHHVLALTSWRRVLAMLLQHLEAARDADAVADVRQLQGLCDRMDAEAFMPLRSEELTSGLPRRICDFYNLIENHFVQKAAAEGWCSIHGSTASGGKYYYARSFKIRDINCNIRLDFWDWSHKKYTPFWIRLFAGDRRHKQALREALISGNVPVMDSSVRDTALEIPLDVPLGKEQDHVVLAVATQIGTIYDLVKAVTWQEYSQQNQQ